MGLLDGLVRRYNSRTYHRAGLKDPDEAASDFMILNEEVNEALFIHWKMGLDSDDPAVMRAAARRALPVLNRMNTLLDSDGVSLTAWGMPIEALGDYQMAMRWYIEAGKAWLADDRDTARYWGIEASKKYDLAVAQFEAAGR